MSSSAASHSDCFWPADPPGLLQAKDPDTKAVKLLNDSQQLLLRDSLPLALIHLLQSKGSMEVNTARTHSLLCRQVALDLERCIKTHGVALATRAWSADTLCFLGYVSVFVMALFMDDVRECFQKLRTGSLRPENGQLEGVEFPELIRNMPSLVQFECMAGAPASQIPLWSEFQNLHPYRHDTQQYSRLLWELAEPIRGADGWSIRVYQLAQNGFTKKSAKIVAAWLSDKKLQKEVKQCEETEADFAAKTLKIHRASTFSLGKPSYLNLTRAQIRQMHTLKAAAHRRFLKEVM